MNKLRFTLSALALGVLGLSLTSSARAQATGPQRTFVSAQRGSDANDCTVTQPCRNFDRAILVVLASGEVVALDSGGYGPVTINKAVTVTGPTGVYVAITAQSGDAITVTAAPTDTVVLRGLTLKGLGASDGIKVTSVGVLHVENCVISGFSQHGISVNYVGSSMTFIKDTIVRDGGFFGIVIQTGSGVAAASIDRCRVENHPQTGIYVGNNSRVTIRDSVVASNLIGLWAHVTLVGTRAELHTENSAVANNDFVGIYAGGSSSHGPAIISVSNSTVANNSGTGVRSQLNGTIRLSTNTITRNTYGVSNDGGTIESLGNNLVRGNAVETTGLITPLSGM